MEMIVINNRQHTLADLRQKLANSHLPQWESKIYQFILNWFDEKDFFQFYPLHVVKKLQGKSRKKRRIFFKDGTWGEANLYKFLEMALVELYLMPSRVWTMPEPPNWFWGASRALGGSIAPTFWAVSP